MKEIPVTIGFDNTRIIGMMTIDENQLPKGYDYVFSLGVRLLDEQHCELMQVGLIDNSNYLEYLQGANRKSET